MGRHFSQRQLRDAFGLFATGVTVVTAVHPEGHPFGATVNSFTSVSLDPPLLLWCLSSSSTGLAAFAVGSAFAVHVLAHQQRDLALHFARRSRDKFEVDLYWRSNPHPPHLAEALCRFDCRVEAVHPGGDHAIIIGEVLGFAQHPGAALAFHQGRFGTFAADQGVQHIDPWHAWQGEWL